MGVLAGVLAAAWMYLGRQDMHHQAFATAANQPCRIHTQSSVRLEISRTTLLYVLITGCGLSMLGVLLVVAAAAGDCMSCGALVVVRLFCRGLGPALHAKRALLEPALKELGLPVLPAQGTYFLVADVSSLLKPGEDDVTFCKRLTSEAGVTLIPISAFYASDQRPHQLVRFCFCKTDEKILAAVERLKSYLAAGQQPIAL
jgi:hypothetical protein